MGSGVTGPGHLQPRTITTKNLAYWVVLWGGGGLELSEPKIEAPKPTQNPEIPKKHRVYTNFIEKFARTFPYFPVTRVRNPTEIIQKNLFR